MRRTGEALGRQGHRSRRLKHYGRQARRQVNVGENAPPRNFRPRNYLTGARSKGRGQNEWRLSSARLRGGVGENADSRQKVYIQTARFGLDEEPF